MICGKCNTENPAASKFCGECGAKLTPDGAPASHETLTEEKRQVTVFFADLSGFTALSEKLDAEEVKAIMQRAFSASAAIVKKYDGRIDKFIGDCVMAVFGVPRAREDDAVRAIHAALEIRAAVGGLNTPELEARIGRKLSMHTGINTGMVISGDLDIEKGSERVLGDTVNVASRLAGVAARGEIVVGRDTFTLAEWHFDFEEMPPVSVKGKAERLLPYRIIGQKKAVETFRRLRGRKAELIGREREIGELLAAAKGLASGKGTVVSVSGDAGTGKSRLVAELKTLVSALPGYEWRQAFAYSHSENIAYSLWIDFVNRLLSIEESDAKEVVQKKLEGIGSYSDGEAILPFIAALYATQYPETKDIDPGYLKTRIAQSIVLLVRAIAEKAMTVFYLEDLHWADPSSLEILRKLLRELDVPAMFICVHRPGTIIGTEPATRNGPLAFREVALSPLESIDEERMIASLLDTDRVPQELVRYVLRKISGNPFYIEEIVNNLIETKVLSPVAGSWALTRDLTETDIPLTIQGVIAARIDRLDPVPKRVLQTASVIGRSFYYSLLKRLTEPSGGLDECIGLLESIDVIREYSREPDIAYLFKHALMQEVVYNSLMKKERGAVHQRVAEVMETVFGERIEEFYETIAFHYQKSGARDKAVEYLIKAGRKSMASYASQEANAFYRQAYDVITSRAVRTTDENVLLIRLLNDWGFAHYSLGTFHDWADSFRKHISDADSIPDRGARALFYAELGYALDYPLETRLADQYQKEALRLAEEAGDKRALAYAHCWRATACGFRGLLVEGIEHGDAGMKLAEEFPDEPYLLAKSGFGKAYCLALRGNRVEATRTAQIVREFGEKRRNSRCLSLAYYALGEAEYYSGNSARAVQYYRESSTVTMEPFYTNFAKPSLALALTEIGEFQEAEEILSSCGRFFGDVRSLVSVLLVDSGRSLLLYSRQHDYSKAFRIFADVYSRWNNTDFSATIAYVSYMLGSVYLGMVTRSEKVAPSDLLKNLPFIIANLPFAYSRAVKQFQRSLDIAKQCGIFSIHGRSALSLGILHKRRRKLEMAREYLNEAIGELAKTDLTGDLEKARMELQGIPDAS